MAKKKSPFLIKLGLHIKELRKIRSLTQADLAYRIKKDQQSIQRLESGGVNPSIEYLKEIAWGMKVPLASLISFEMSEDGINSRTNRNSKNKKNIIPLPLAADFPAIAAEFSESSSQNIRFDIPEGIKIHSFHSEVIRLLRENIAFLEREFRT